MKSFVPRKLTHDSAEYLGLIARSLAQGEFDLAGPWRFTLAPLAEARPWPDEAIALSVEWGGAAFQLIAPASLLRLSYAHRFPATDLAVLPAELAMAGFELAWDEVLTRLEALGGRKLRLNSIGPVSPEQALPGAFAFSLQLDSIAAGDGLPLLLLAAEPGLALLALLARNSPPPAPAAPNPEWPIPLRLELGETRLSVAELQSLRRHDVILLDGTEIDPSAPLLSLRPDERHHLLARLKGCELTLESVLEIVAMSAPPNETSENPARINDIEIRLSFDLGDKLLPLGELAALQAGQVFTLDAPPTRAVAIRANGKLIGRGELLQVDEGLGVRVLELAGDAA